MKKKLLFNIFLFGILMAFQFKNESENQLNKLIANISLEVQNKYHLIQTGIGGKK